MLDSERRRWLYHVTQLKHLRNDGQIELIFQGSLTQIFGWVNSSRRRNRKNVKLWVEALDEPARVIKKGGPKKK